MTTGEDKQEFVGRAATAFADAEKKLHAAREAVGELSPLMTVGRQLGMAGFLQASRMKADLLSAMGLVARAESLVYAVHSEGTEIAKTQGVDVPQPEGGGDR